MILVTVANIYESLGMNECCIFQWGSYCNPDRDKFTVPSLSHALKQQFYWSYHPLLLAPADETTGRFLGQGHTILSLSWACGVACCEEHSQ